MSELDRKTERHKDRNTERQNERNTERQTTQKIPQSQNWKLLVIKAKLCILKRSNQKDGITFIVIILLLT